MFLAGIRFGEASALRWRHYDAGIEPLGKLSIAKSYSTKLKTEKEVKTKVPRDVPVHSVLAALLAQWKLSGWPAMFGRAPRPDDLIIPSRLGKNRSVNHMLKRFHEDLERLGIRPRRQHDLRRTFISLCLGDGGRSDILRWVTHSRPKVATIDDYTTLVWNPLCEEVAKLRITLRGPPDHAISAIANLANSYAPTMDGATGFATGSGFENDLAVLRLRGGRDLKVRPPAGHAGTVRDSDGQTAENHGLGAVADGPERPHSARECRSVSALVAAAIMALERGDVASVRALLRELAVVLGGRSG